MRMETWEMAWGVWERLKEEAHRTCRILNMVQVSNSWRVIERKNIFVCRIDNKWTKRIFLVLLMQYKWSEWSRLPVLEVFQGLSFQVGRCPSFKITAVVLVFCSHFLCFLSLGLVVTSALHFLCWLKHRTF